MFQFPLSKQDNSSTNLPIGKLDPSWHSEDEGELKVDVFETPDAIFVRMGVAGARPENLDIFLNNDMLTIRGRRQEEHGVSKNDYYLRECFWGKFSRSIILPKHVETAGAEAILKNGLLTIKLSKAEAGKNIKVKMED